MRELNDGANGRERGCSSVLIGGQGDTGSENGSENSIVERMVV